MSVNLRIRGNQFFAKAEYKLAIECYKQYVQKQNEDNAKAYFNLSLCYYKLKDHQKQIQACYAALERDKTYTKVYYRLMKAFQQIKHKDYQAFINAIQYLRYDSKVDQKQKGLILKAIDDFKQKIRIKVRGRQLDAHKQDQSFVKVQNLRRQITQNQQVNQSIDKYLSEWIDEWNSQVQSQDAKWQQIAYIIQNQNYDYGINLAYFYLNTISDKQKRSIISQKIKDIKRQMGKVVTRPISQNHPQVTPQKYQNQEEKDKISCSSQQNLFESASSPQKRQSPSSMQLQNTTQNNALFSPSQEKNIKHSPNKQPKPYTASTSKKQLLAKKRQEKEQITKINQPLNQQQIEILLERFIQGTPKCKNIVAQTFRTVQSILNSNQTQTTKQRLLVQLKKRTKKLSLIVLSFTPNEKKLIYDLLLLNNIPEFARDYSPDYYRP